MKKLFLLTLLTLFSFLIFAQDGKETLFTVNNEAITVAEFEKVFQKNNYSKKKPTKADIDEYLELYIKFKLKVKEAYAEGLDTNKKFVNELATYRKQLAQPYLTDKAASERLLQEAYERSKKEIRASHILIRISENASPKDTAKAYDQIIRIRNRIVAGEDFGSIASEVSQDPSAKENKGDLGYFSVLRMIYPFENVAFNTPIGNVSMPFRTQFGYHILKTIDERPAQGEIQVAHIMVVSREDQSEEEQNAAKTKIDEIYTKLMEKPDDFENLAKQYSEDPATAKNGGTLPFFGSGRMVPEFEEVAFKLKNDGDIAKPVKTRYGWHIMKRIQKKAIPDFEASKNDLKIRIERDGRSFMKRNSLIEKLKKEYKVQTFNEAKNSLITAVDSTFMQGKWAAEKFPNNSGQVLKIENKYFTQLDFASYIQANQSGRAEGDKTVILNKMFERFVNDKVIDYEDKKLESKYPEFRDLMKEYREGILLFELTDQKVWSKAVKDTTGLQNFYKKNQKKYLWPQRLDAEIFTCDNQSVANQVKKYVKKKKFTNEEIIEKINAKSTLNLKITPGKFAKGDNDAIDKIAWKKGVSKNISLNKSVVFVNVKKVLSPEPKELDEVRGLVTSDYQNFLEKDWIQGLKDKYKVQVNDSVLQKLYQKY